MRNLTILSMLFIFHVVVIREVQMECQQNKQQLLIENYEGITDEFLIWKGLVASKMKCLHKCYYDLRCITFQYAQNGACRTYATTGDKLKTFKTGTEQGAFIYKFSSRGGFGEECKLDDECHFPNSECRQSTCGCIIGYNFNPMKHTCTNGCTEYGNTYAIFPSTGLYGSDLEYIGSGSLTDCKDLCSSQSNCKSFDYLPSNPLCILKNGGVLDDPSQLAVGLTTTMHGVRNCKN